MRKHKDDHRFASEHINTQAHTHVQLWQGTEERVCDSALTAGAVVIHQHWVWYLVQLPGSLTHMTDLSEGVTELPVPALRTVIHPITCQRLNGRLYFHLCYKIFAATDISI